MKYGKIVAYAPRYPDRAENWLAIPILMARCGIELDGRYSKFAYDYRNFYSAFVYQDAFNSKQKNGTAFLDKFPCGSLLSGGFEP